MKKLLLNAVTFSIIFFQCQASEQTPEEFFNTEITREYIEIYYPGFIVHTQNQYDQMHGILAKTAGFFGRFLGKSESDTLERLAGLYGYNENSRRLLGIGRLILDDTWQLRLDNAMQNCSDEQFIYLVAYLNNAKMHVRRNFNARHATHEALNQVMQLIHEFHVDSLQVEQHFDGYHAAHLKENIQKNENGLFPMHAHLENHKNQNGGEVHPYAIWNMFLAYLFALHKVTSKGS